jgi:hypothetical protein
MLERNEHRLIWLAVALSGLALMVALGSFASTHRFDRDARIGSAPPVAAPAAPEQDPAPRAASARDWHHAPPFAKRWHDGPAPHWHSPFDYHHGFNPKSLLLGGVLIALGIGLLRRNRPDEEPRDPPADAPNAPVV